VSPIRPILLLICVSLLPAWASARQPLLPYPQQMRYGAGRLPVRGLTITFGTLPNPEDRFAAAQLSATLSARAGSPVLVVAGRPSGNTIALYRSGPADDLAQPGEHPGPKSPEAYSIEITIDHANVRAQSSRGLFYAVQTLTQLVEGTGANASLPAAQIRDWPSLAYRGVMVDMSHGALPTEKEVERQLDFLARWKTNQYYFYSEDSIALKGFPLINPEGRFTQDQVRRIVAYGRERHIDVIPCLELYGHQHDLFRIEKYSALSDLPHGTEFDPTNPQVNALLADWANQFADLFPSSFVHIGFDETFQIELAAQKGGMAAKPARLFIHQLNYVDGLFRHYGKTVLAWGDIMAKYPAIVPRLPPGLIAIDWDYHPGPPASYEPRLGPLVREHVPHMIATGVWCWNQIACNYSRSFDNVDTFLAAARPGGMLGLINTLWTDDAQELMRAVWPGLAYGAAAAWRSAPINHQSFFVSYSQLMYAPAISADVAQALKHIDGAEGSIERVIGQESMVNLWKDPFTPAILKRCDEDLQDLRQARLEAEDAETRLDEALSKGGDPITLKCLLFGSRLLDYAGEKFQTAPELEVKWKSVGPRRPNADLWWDEWDSQVTYQDHSRLVDLMDAITELRPRYKHAWLAEYTPYRLDSALGRWDAEYQYWRAVQARLVQFSDSSRDGQLLPPLETVVKLH
jgi:hexosaminidase